jgi:DNA-binding CsgD family transcriptional regulator
MVLATSHPVRRGQLLAAVERLGHGDLDGAVVIRRLARELRAAVPCQGLLLLRTDPTTVLPTEGVVEDLPPALCKPFWDNELLEPDVNKFVALARSEVPAATLLEATDGDLRRSHRFGAMYAALGISDELRASFTTRDGSCWGIVQLARTGGATFSGLERDLLAAVAPVAAAALRSGFLSTLPAQPQPAGPALVILNEAGEIQSITPEARGWLAEIVDGTATPMLPVPEPVYAVAARALAVRDGLDTAPACAQVRTARSGWLHLHASCFEGGAGVGIVVTPSQAPDLVPLLALCYRLTHREQEVLEFLARGMTTVEITRRLGISAHTVRDHIKSLFAKVGVRSRAELVARIFAEHYFDRLEASVSPV